MSRAAHSGGGTARGTLAGGWESLYLAGQPGLVVTQQTSAGVGRLGEGEEGEGGTRANWNGEASGTQGRLFCVFCVVRMGLGEWPAKLAEVPKYTVRNACAGRRVQASCTVLCGRSRRGPCTCTVPHKRTGLDRPSASGWAARAAKTVPCGLRHFRGRSKYPVQA